jgi:sugar/nucleoside kinase (ribokinase family)
MPAPVNPRTGPGDGIMQPVSPRNVDCLSVGILVADHLCDPIDRMPAAGEIILCPRLPLAIGGCASNVAVDLARLGFDVGVVGCVGQDYFGRFVIDTLAAAGVEVADIRQLADAETSGTLIINVRDQDRRFIHAAGANARLNVDAIPLERVRSAKILYIGGYFLMPALEGPPLAQLFRQARSFGVKTVLDVVMPSRPDAWSGLKAVLAETDIFLPNEEEAAALSGSSDPCEQARFFAAAGAGTVVITRGGEGSVLVSGKTQLRADAFATEYRGGTGAGDAFDAGFIAGLLRGEDLQGCLRWASAVGASCVRSISATDSVFTRAEAEQFLRGRDLRIVPF